MSKVNLTYSHLNSQRESQTTSITDESRPEVGIEDYAHRVASLLGRASSPVTPKRILSNAHSE